MRQIRPGAARIPKETLTIVNSIGTGSLLYTEISNVESNDICNPEEGFFVRQPIILAALAAVMSLVFPATTQAQALNACDLSADGRIDLLDFQLSINMGLGLVTCTANVIGPGVCNIILVQRIVNAAMGGACFTSSLHSATLNWTASTSAVAGYNIYRSNSAAGPYTKLNSSPVNGTSFSDNAVWAGQTYYYVTTAVDSNGNESVYSNQAIAVIPSP